MKTPMVSHAETVRAIALAVVLSVFICAPAWAGVGGSLDAVFANNGIGSNRVCLNNGSGSFTCSVVVTDFHNDLGVAVGDVDEINGLDIVFANAGVTKHNRVCLNDGTGGFICSDINIDVNFSRDVALGDLDGVNGLDAVFANFASLNRVCLNDGTGGFTCSDVSTSTQRSFGVALGDVDGVNGLDIVFANGSPIETQQNEVCLNDGSGSFTCSLVSTDFTNSQGVALGDVDGVNGLDIVFAADLQRNRVCLNNGSGSFTCGDVSTDMNRSVGVALGDLDGVNGLDMVFSNGFPGDLQRNRVCLNNGSGSFTCSDVSTDTNSSFDVALGDVDGTNGLDIVFANDGGNTPQRNRVCLNNGSGNFICSDVSTDTNESAGVALGDMTSPSPPPVPALSMHGTMLALLLLILGGTIAGLSRRRRRRTA